MKSEGFCFACCLLVITYSVLHTFQPVEAKQVDVREETERYKKIIVTKNNCRDKCKELESYQEYVTNYLSRLNAQFNKNRYIYKSIEKYGTFENYTVTLSNIREEELQKYARYLDDNGIRIKYSEGDMYLQFDPTYIVKNFKDVLPMSVLEYYSIAADDVGETFTKDDALAIPWDGLRKQIIRYEKFLDSMDKIDCLYIEELTKRKIMLYLSAYLKGMDNRQVCENIKEAKISYEQFLADNKDSRFYNIIRTYYSILKENNFNFGQKEEIKGGNRYIFRTVCIDKNKEVVVEALADSYLKYIDW